MDLKSSIRDSGFSYHISATTSLTDEFSAGKIGPDEYMRKCSSIIDNSVAVNILESVVFTIRSLITSHTNR